MVERTEIAREARRMAQRIVDDAEAQARRLVHEAEDYIDQKLAAFEVVLERTLQAVQKGRTRLQVAADPIVPAGDVADAEGLGGEFFDQDERLSGGPSVPAAPSGPGTGTAEPEIQGLCYPGLVHLRRPPDHSTGSDEHLRPRVTRYVRTTNRRRRPPEPPWRPS